MTKAERNTARHVGNRAKGCCYDCGRKTELFRCDACRERVNEYRRARKIGYTRKRA
jgi:hypothetical protein